MLVPPLSNGELRIIRAAEFLGSSLSLLVIALVMLHSLLGCSMKDLGRGLGEGVVDKLAERMPELVQRWGPTAPVSGSVGGAAGGSQGSGDGTAPPVAPYQESWWVTFGLVLSPLLLREIDKRFIRKEIKNGK